MHITIFTHLEGKPDKREKEPARQKITKTWFNAMLHQVETARYSIPSSHKSYGHQPNGQLFPAFDINRHGLAAAYLLHHSKGRMFTKPEESDNFASGDSSGYNMKSITDGLSDIGIVNKGYWKPTSCLKSGRKASHEDKNFELDRRKRSSLSSSVLTRSLENDGRRTKTQVQDKLEDQRVTAEMELSAKGCIESCAGFKLLFVPGYELECSEQYYEDPIATDQTSGTQRRLSDASQDKFINRFFALSKLEDDTSCNEDRRKTFENLFCVSKYNGAYKERRLMSDRRSQTGGLSTQSMSTLADRATTIKTRPSPMPSGRRSKVKAMAKGLSYAEDMFCSASGAAKSLMSECNELGFGCDRTSSEDTDSLPSNDASAKGGASQGKRLDRNARRRCSKDGGPADLMPSKFYDIKEIATTYAPPCEEKMKEGIKTRNRNSAPGKSYFSQRRNSLTSKPSGRRPVTAVVRKRRASTQRRPNTANVDTRSHIKELEG